MSSTIRVVCPRCQATLKVSETARGKQIACPKCQHQFRIAQPKSEAPVPPSDEDPFASLDLPSMTASSGSFANSPAFPSAQSSADSSAWAPKKRDKPKPKKSKSSDDEELSESDANLQSTGIFLVVVPVLAAILPMFGLQLKRLARMPEYAPLGAMVLGLIGAGIIVYARRNRSDSMLAGLGAVAVTLIFGVGGFLLQRESFQPEAAAPRSQTTQPPSPEQLTILEEQRARMLKEQKEEFEKRVEESKNRLGARPPLGNSPPPMSNRMPFENPGSESSKDDPFAEPPAMDSKSSSLFGRDELLEQEFEWMSELSRKSVQAFGQFARSQQRNSNFLSKYTIENQVGTPSNMGKLYADDRVQALCGLHMGPELNIIPIEPKDNGVRHAVQPEEGQMLVGLKLAFDGPSIVGFQGLIQGSEGADPAQTDWIGRTTEDVRTSLNPKPGKCGIVTFSSQGKLTGFGWVQPK